MATKKQVTATESAAAAAPARAAKPNTAAPRVRTVKHSKNVVAESSIPVQQPALTQMEAVPVETDHHAAISLIAYGYWESRGYQGGSQEEDWLRAEQEYRQSLEQI
jgi:hypothetical protein